MDLQARQRSGVNATLLSASKRRSQGLDHDDLGESLADRQARVAHLANEIGLAGEQSDDLVFSKAEFAQPVLNLRCRAQLLDPDLHTGLDPAQRTNLATCFLRSIWLR